MLSRDKKFKNNVSEFKHMRTNENVPLTCPRGSNADQQTRVRLRPTAVCRSSRCRHVVRLQCRDECRFGSAPRRYRRSGTRACTTRRSGIKTTGEPTTMQGKLCRGGPLSPRQFCGFVEEDGKGTRTQLVHDDPAWSCGVRALASYEGKIDPPGDQNPISLIARALRGFALVL